MAQKEKQSRKKLLSPKVYIVVLLIFIITSVYMTMKPKAEVNKEVKKDWSSYITSQIDSETRPLYQKVIKEYFNEKNLKKNYQYRAVNFGSGAGIEDIELVNKGWEVLSIDLCHLSKEIIDINTRNSKGKSVFFEGDFLDAKLTDNYDLIMSFYSLPFGKKQNLDSLLKKIITHLQSNGIFVANFFGEEHEFVKNGKAYGVSQKELLFKLIDYGFEIIEFKKHVYSEKSFSSEGKKINWEVFEIIAKKK